MIGHVVRSSTAHFPQHDQLKEDHAALKSTHETLKKEHKEKCESHVELEEELKKREHVIADQVERVSSCVRGSAIV